MGLIFENLAIRDLRIYSQLLNGDIYHFRDKTGLECDAVLHLRNGSYGLIEIKLGGDKLIEEGVANLIKLSGLIDQTKMKAPSFMMILCAIAPYAYQRKDGVYIVPISCLKP
jgi:predicted AAA+ superfamily ATPase